MNSTPGLAAEIDRVAISEPAVAATVASAAIAATPISLPSIASDELAPGDTVAYPTLAAAVAAQDAASDDKAIHCLAGAIYFESKGEPLAGQLAVADVIINRAESGRFPSDICDVVTQRGQFGFVRGGRIPAVDEDSTAYRTAIGVAKVALAEAWDGVADQALFFNRGRAPSAGLRRVAAIGNHTFWR